MLTEPKIDIHDPQTRARLLAELYTAQEQHSWLSPEAVKQVANRLDLTPGQVYSTASFYTMFHLQPQGQFRIQVCEGLSCYLVDGAETLLDHLSNRLEIQPGETTLDGKFSLEIVQCLAACDVAPAMLINDELYARVNPKRIDEILTELAARPQDKEHV